MFNGKKIEEIMEVVYESQAEIRETNRRLASSNVKRLEDMVDNKREFANIHTRLDVVTQQQEFMVNALAALINGQEQLLKNQAKYIPLQRKKRKKSLTNATGWTTVKAAEKAQFLEMFNRGLSVTDIANQTGRSTGTVSNHLRAMGADNETTNTKSE